MSTNGASPVHDERSALPRRRSYSCIKAGPGKDIWLFGGGGLFRTLLEAGLVDLLVSICLGRDRFEPNGV